MMLALTDVVALWQKIKKNEVYMASWLDPEKKCANPVLTVTINQSLLPITQHNWLRYGDRVVRHSEWPRSIANTQVMTIT